MIELLKIIIPLKIFCPHCGTRHIDEPRDGKRWDRIAHTTHRCQQCAMDFDVFVSGVSDDAGFSPRFPTPPPPRPTEGD